MKSNNNKLVTVIKRVNFGVFPVFVRFMHKGLEKAQPSPIRSDTKTQTFSVPKDIFQISVSDPDLYKDITSVEFTYSKTED